MLLYLEWKTQEKQEQWQLTLGASCEPYRPLICGCAPSGCACFWRRYPWPLDRDCGTWRTQNISSNSVIDRTMSYSWSEALTFMLTCACQFFWTPCSDEEDVAGFSCAASMTTSPAYEHWLYPFSYLDKKEMTTIKLSSPYKFLV